MALKKFISGLHSLESLVWHLRKDSALRKIQRWIVPSTSTALEFRDLLKSLLPEAPVVVFLPLETDLLRNRGPSLGRRVERLKALTLSQIHKETIWIESLEAWAGPLPNRSLFLKRCLTLRLGQELDREELLSELHARGYLPSEVVEQPLQYALRGSIVDCFLPHLDHPLRIELFGDAVQSLRLFQTESQRRILELEQVLIPPAHESLYPQQQEDQEKLRAKLRLHLEELDTPKPKRDAFLSRIQQLSFFPTLDYWGPLIDPQAFVSAQDWLDGFPATSTAVLEPQSSLQQLQLSHRSVEKNFETARVEEEWIPQFLSFSSARESLLESWSKNSPELEIWASLQTNPLLSEEGHREHLPRRIQSIDGLLLELNSLRTKDNPQPLGPLVEKLTLIQEKGHKLLLTSESQAPLERLQFLLKSYEWGFQIHSTISAAIQDPHPVSAFVSELSRGFSDEIEGLTILTTSDIFGTPSKKRRKRASSFKPQTTNKDFGLVGLKPGDLVVHKTHGIGRYLGTRSLSVGSHDEEFLELEYKEQHKLLVPVTRLNLIQKHTSASDLSLDRLGGSTWETKKVRVRRELQSMAGELLHLYSLREMSEAPPLLADPRRVAEFASSFPFEETPDQSKAIEAVLNGLSKKKPMDHLVCGDVGFGKTEVALRAVHSAVACGFQAVVLVPTTILAAQHELSFQKRLSPFGIRVDGVSRFKSPSEIKDTQTGLKSGAVHVVVGTHKVLSSQFVFSNLGLLIIDEEQRFGVSHKERIKKMRNNVHVLSMSATPIPRTLNMAMGGLKDVSIMSTAPVDRLSVRTFVARKNEALIQEAIGQELARGGQVFYVHNRIETLPLEFELLSRCLPPGATIDMAHGQMDETALENKMLNFYKGQTQVLLSTAIVESGLDVPNANTIFVNRADMLGLSQLYQLRGRVGRSTERGFAYFLLPESGHLSRDAEERLAVLETYQDLGSGFQIASHDLEIRGAGDLLGRSQSGFIASLGFETYVELLQHCVAEVRGETLEAPLDPEIQLGLDLTIPENYLPDQNQRLLLYRRLSAAPDEPEIMNVEAEMLDRFGTPPPSVKNLIQASKIKCQLRRLRISNLKAGKAGYSLIFDASTPIRAEDLVRAVSKYPQHFQALPDGRLIIKKPLASGEGFDNERVLRGVELALAELESWC